MIKNLSELRVRESYFTVCNFISRPTSCVAKSESTELILIVFLLGPSTKKIVRRIWFPFE